MPTALQRLRLKSLFVQDSAAGVPGASHTGVITRVFSLLPPQPRGPPELRGVSAACSASGSCLTRGFACFAGDLLLAPPPALQAHSPEG